MKNLFVVGSLLLFVQFTYAQENRQVYALSYPRLIKEASQSPRGFAQGVFRRHFAMGPEDELRPARSWQDELGYSHDQFQQYYRNIKVEGATYTIHARNNTIETLSGEYKGIVGLSVVPSQTAEQALQMAMQHVGASIYAWDERVNKGYPGYSKPTGELVIIGGSDGDKTGPRLAWKFDIYAATPLYRAYIYIDAQNGKFLYENLRIHQANAPVTGTTLYNGTVSFTADYTGSYYRLFQTASGGGVQTYSLGNTTDYTKAAEVTSSTTSFTGDPTANQAHYGAEKTYDYFKTQHNRNSYDNAGAPIKSYVHYSVNYVNAFWDGSRMTYGDGDVSQGYKPLVSLDICGHEIAHGVTEYAANLTYSYESGALNESFSDIFGEAVEYYAKGTNDWLMSCDIGATGCGAFRSMAQPNLYGDPDTYKGTNWYSGSGDNGGVHINSGVQNKWFYILVNGESGTNDLGNSYSVTGLGWTKAAKIAYRNLTVYLTASSGFAAARTGAIQSAVDLFGAGSPEVVATTNAWYAVGVGCEYGALCYCVSSASNQTDEWIAGVDVGSFTNPSGASVYTFFNSKKINANPGATVSFTLTPGYRATQYAEYWRIWIDYNKDSDFEDAGELVYNPSTAASNARTGSLTFNSDASGTTRMRVSMKWGAAPLPCEAYQWGEVEDYLIDFSSGSSDTTAPSAPVLSSNAKTATSVSLSWTAATDNVGVSGYDVLVNGVKNNSSNITGTTYTVNSLTSVTSYEFQVIAKDAAGNSKGSNLINVTTNDGIAPSAPVLSSPSKTASSIDLSWTAATDNVGVSGYDVYLNGNKNNSSNITGTTYSVTGLASVTTYSLQVRAKDTSGNSTASNTLSVTTSDGIAPSSPTLTVSAKTVSTIALSWTAATDNVSVTGYDVYVDGAKNNTSNVSGLSYTVSGLTSETSYSIHVRARDAAGNTSNSNTVVESTPAPDNEPPTSPTLSSGAVSDSTIALQWTAASDNIGVEGYDVYVSGVKKNTQLITSLSYTVTGLTAQTSYALYVIAKDAAGNNGTSNTISITTPDTKPPSSPVLTSPSKTESSVNLSWTTSADNVGLSGYDVYVNGTKHNSSVLTTTTYTVGGLSASTSYSFYVQARDLSSNTSNSNTLSVTTSAAAATSTRVIGNTYESTLESWVASSTANCFRSTNATNAYEGSGSMLIQSKNTTATRSNIALNGFTQVEIRFHFKGMGMETGKKFSVSYNNGVNSTYTTLATFTSAASYSGTNFVTNTSFYRAVVTMNAASFSSTSRLRFTIAGANTSDQVFIDSLSVIGRTGTSGSGNTVSMVPVTTLNNVLMEPIRSVSSRDVFDVQLYPNPVDRTLSIASPERILWVRIFSSAGALVYEGQPNRNGHQVDAASMPPGWYLAEITTENGVQRKKFVRQ